MKLVKSTLLLSLLVAITTACSPSGELKRPEEFQTKLATDGNRVGTSKWKSRDSSDPGFELIPFLNHAEVSATADGKRILVMGRTMIDSQAIVIGSCWDYISAVYKRAGYSGKGIVTLFASKQAGPYADLSTIQAGDWLYFINHSYGDVEHSAIFIGWTDQNQAEALMLSYAGGNQAVPARYKVYELTSVYNIMRPKPGTASALPLLPDPAPPLFMNPAFFESPGKSQPVSLALGKDGILYVINASLDQIEKYDSSGIYLGAIAVNGPSANTPALLADLLIDPDGNLFVLEQGSHQIEKFSPSGTSLAVYGWLSAGEVRGTISPDRFTMDQQGNFYVNDAGTKRVIKLNSQGGRLAFELTGLSDSSTFDPSFIRMDPKGNLWVYEMEANRVDRFNSDGTFSMSIVAPLAGPGLFANLAGMNFDASGNLYLLDGHQGLIFEFDLSGKFVQQLKNRFSLPTSIDFDSNGNAFVTDLERGRVIKIKVEKPSSLL